LFFKTIPANGAGIIIFFLKPFDTALLFGGLRWFFTCIFFFARDDLTIQHIFGD